MSIMIALIYLYYSKILISLLNWSAGLKNMNLVVLKIQKVGYRCSRVLWSIHNHDHSQSDNENVDVSPHKRGSENSSKNVPKLNLFKW